MRLVDPLTNPMLYDDPTRVQFTVAEMAAIDTANSSDDLHPYSYKSSAGQKYENIIWQENTATPPEVVAGHKFAVGTFLTNESNEKGNLMFTCNGSAQFATEQSVQILMFPFFGRTSASGITSSKAVPSNILAKYQILPCNYWFASNLVQVSWNVNVLNILDTDGENFVHGLCIQNQSGVDCFVTGMAGLSFIKDLYTVPFSKPRQVIAK